ncbi:MAG: TraR/DksA family transcriptional regulator [Treponema sp.]|nr:TraR/DksA family transcriptional regulator [Candidatus Treponema equifaecale]
MDQAFIQKMETELLSQKEQILKSLAEQNSDYKKLVENEAPGDEVDIASDVIDGKMLETLGVQDQNRLLAINNALERIKKGVYGICPICHQEIPQERLETIPEAVLCIKCKSAQERQHH